MPLESELGFPEFCCPLLTPGGANVTKGIMWLVPGGANVTKGVVPLVPGGAGMAIVPTTLPPGDPKGGSMMDGAGADAWTLPMEGLGTTGVPPGVITIALVAAPTEGLRTTMGVPPGVIGFCWKRPQWQQRCRWEGGEFATL
jgi:hypothetical protein